MFTMQPCKHRRAAELLVVGDADIRREFAADLVAQPEPGIDIRQASADQARRITPSPDFSRGYLTRRPAPMILAVDGV